MAETRLKALSLNDDIAERRRAAILEAAEELLAVHGFDALRLRDVAARAGVSIGMIQHYFVTRDGLLRETVRVASEHRVAAWARQSHFEGSATERLAALLEGALDDRHRCTIWVETCAAATRHPDLRDDVRRTQDAWRNALREVVQVGVMRGEFSPPGNIDDGVSMLVSLIDGLMLEIATDRDPDAGAAVRRRLLWDFGRRLFGIAVSDE